MYYLDNATQSWPKPAAVYQALDSAIVPPLARSARQYRAEIVQAAQVELAQLVNAPEPERIAFTSGCEAAVSLAFQQLPWQAGDGVVISAVEHRAMVAPVLHLARTQGVQFYIVPYTSTDPFSVAECEALLKAHPKIRLIATAHASNVTGCVLPVREISRLARQYDKLMLLDASQTAGLLPLDVQGDGIDMLALSGSQALQGPSGVGALYVGNRVASQLPGLIQADHAERFILPEGFWGDGAQADGLILARIAALTAGLCWARSMGLSAIHRRPNELLLALQRGLDEIPEVTLYGRSEESRGQLPTVAFNVLNHHPEVLANRLFEEFGVWLRAGFHDSRLAHEAIGTIHRGGALRASLGCHSRVEDVEALLSALKSIIMAAESGAWGLASRL